MMRRGLLLAIAGLLAATVAGFGQARADFELIWEPPVRANNTWDYSAYFNTQVDPTTGQPAATLTNGSFVTLYDFGGYVNGSLHVNSLYASMFNFTVQNTGITPNGISVPDSPSLINVTATYIGPDLTTTTAFIDLFTLQTTFGGTTPAGSFFAGQVTKSSGPSTGTPIASFGQITTPSAIPEPASLVMVGLGLGGVGLVARSRRRAKA